MPDNIIVTREHGGLWDLTRNDTVIMGASPGTVTPSSVLTICERSCVKHVPFRFPVTEGFVDWTDPNRVEVRILIKEPQDSFQLATNGIHRIYDSAGSGIDLNKLDLPPRSRRSPNTGVIRQGQRKAEQAGAGQPATRSESDSEGGDKAQPESEGRSR